MQHQAQTLEIHIVICASTPRAEAGGIKHPPPPVDLCQSTLWLHHSNEGSHQACTYTGTKPSERSLTSLCIRSRCSSPVVWLRESGLCNGKSIELVRTGVLVGRKSKYFQLNWFASFFFFFFLHWCPELAHQHFLRICPIISYKSGKLLAWDHWKWFCLKGIKIAIKTWYEIQEVLPYSMQHKSHHYGNTIRRMSRFTLTFPHCKLHFHISCEIFCIWYWSGTLQVNSIRHPCRTKACVTTPSLAVLLQSFYTWDPFCSADIGQGPDGSAEMV